MKHVILFLFTTIVTSRAAVVIDDASNYGGTFANATNGGSGFLPWSISSNNGGAVFAGGFIGSSTAGAGNIDTSGVSFGLYANPTAAFANATRAFVSTLDQGDIFTFRMALNFDNGNKGFDLFAGSMGTVFNFNVGGGAGVSASSGATLTPGTGAGYNYGGNDAVLDVEISATSASSFSYRISRTSSQGFQGTLFAGNVSGLTERLNGFGFYVSGTDNGAAQNNLYFNSLSVVPEPGSAALISLAGAFAFLRRRR